LPINSDDPNPTASGTATEMINLTAPMILIFLTCCRLLFSDLVDGLC
jgi:hypothetical protein